MKGKRQDDCPLLLTRACVGNSPEDVHLPASLQCTFATEFRLDSPHLTYSKKSCNNYVDLLGVSQSWRAVEAYIQVIAEASSRRMAPLLPIS